MKLQKFILTMLGLMMIGSSAVVAAEFDWMINLNVRSHTDPYGYRYSLVDRFGYTEPDVMVILTSVYEPADAYMIFRLAELSGRPPEYILRVYRERRHYGWNDIAYTVGIRPDVYEFVELRERYDTRYIYQPREHYYEDRRDMPVRKVYVEPRHYEQQHEQHVNERREPERNDRREHERHDNRDDDRRDDRDRR